MERDFGMLTLKLFEIADELYAREHSNNTIYEQFHNVSWEEMCDKGMEILEELKVG
mgnify:CR=1 FL=1